MRPRFARTLAGAAACLALAGPAAAGPLAPEAEEARLIVTRAGEDVTLTWQSTTSLVYTVMFAASRDAKAPWKPLQACVSQRGTGRTMTFKDAVPVGTKRFYRLALTPVAPAPVKP
jgi:hypothetical protein